MQRQLQFFSRGELAAMRDRTASRNYSPERDQFRRDHERHRTWGLTQRHARRLRQLRHRPGEHPTPNPATPRTTTPPSARPLHTEQTPHPTPNHTISTHHDPPPLRRRQQRTTPT
ncbi:hypothetical protein ACFFRK_25225, partial [Amorphoplanes digitatis]